MAFHDPVSDLLTRLRNGKMAKHRYVDLHYSKFLIEIVRVLKELGFIEAFIVNDEKRLMRIFLKYSKARQSVIDTLKRVSSPSLRRYVKYHDIPKICGGMGAAILSTSQGVMDGETARNKRIGGELLCLVW